MSAKIRLIKALSKLLKQTPKVTKGAGGAKSAAKVTQGAGGAAKAPGMFSNPLQAGAAPFVGVAKGLASKPARSLYAGLGMAGLASAGIVAAENRLNENSITKLKNRAIGEAKNWDTRTGGIEAPGYGDRFLDFLTGTDRQELENEARIIRQTDFQRNNESLLEKLNSADSSFVLSEDLLTDGRLALGDTTNANAYLLKLKNEVERLNTYERLVEEGVTGLSGTMSPVAMEAAATRYRKTLPTSPESQLARYLDNEQYRRKQDAADRVYRDELLNRNETIERNRLDFQERQAEANRKERMTLEMMNQQNLQADRVDRRDAASRADRREAIAALMAGLSQLGVSLAA